MGIIMAGIDHKTAGVDVRGLFSLTAAAGEELLRDVRQRPGVLGCALLSTCNRTELYLSCDEQADCDAVELLCGAAGVGAGAYEGYFVARQGRRAARHLMMVAAGLRSLVRGEDQILAQVKAAAVTARALCCADGVLETLFRCAVSAGKKAKTVAPLSAVERSVAERALAVLDAQPGGISGMRALVIGNGEMGRLSAALLAARGCAVTMTMRSYKHGGAVIPEGCATVPYDERYRVIPDCGLVLSATASPHFTLRADELRRCASLPRYFVDLAVPRDIEPGVAALPGVACWDVDSLGGNAPSAESAKKLMAVRSVVDEYMARFEKWEMHRVMMPAGRERSR